MSTRTLMRPQITFLQSGKADEDGFTSKHHLMCTSTKKLSTYEPPGANFIISTSLRSVCNLLLPQHVNNRSITRRVRTGLDRKSRLNERLCASLKSNKWDKRIFCLPVTLHKVSLLLCWKQRPVWRPREHVTETERWGFYHNRQEPAAADRNSNFIINDLALTALKCSWCSSIRCHGCIIRFSLTDSRTSQQLPAVFHWFRWTFIERPSWRKYFLLPMCAYPSLYLKQ